MEALELVEYPAFAGPFNIPISHLKQAGAHRSSNRLVGHATGALC
jgi:hypothetical protein